MDFLKAEIARKKRQMESTSLIAPDKKYFKRGDLAAQQEQEYLEKHKPKTKENDEDQKAAISLKGTVPCTVYIKFKYRGHRLIRPN